MNDQITISDSEPHTEKNPISLRFYLISVIPSLLLASILVPMEGDEGEYIIAYIFLFVVSAVLAFLGRKRNMKRYLNAATFLLWTAPFLPIIMMVLLDAIAS